DLGATGAGHRAETHGGGRARVRPAARLGIDPLTEALITAVRPGDVAREVETLLEHDHVSRFVLRPVAHGGMLDQERLGAARYAAGFQAVVELEAAAAAQRR